MFFIIFFKEKQSLRREKLKMSDSEDDLPQNDENRLSEDEDFPMSDNEQEEDESSDDENQEESTDEEGNAGWADSMAKVLNSKKPKNKRTLVLSKAKKIADKRPIERKEYDFQIEGEEVKEEKPDDKELVTELIKAKLLEKSKIKDKILGLRIKPSVFDREREKVFKKIATKGVVQLFNAVRGQQKDLEVKLQEAGTLDHKRDHVLNSLNKRAFLDVLMGGKGAKSELPDNPIKDEEIKSEDDEDDADFDEEESSKKKKSTAWGVLRDDFMAEKKMTHWDQDSEEEDEENVPKSDDSDSSD